MTPEVGEKKYFKQLIKTNIKLFHLVWQRKEANKIDNKPS